jgi:hypothetical protein
MRLADFKLTAADFGTLGQGLQRPECVWIDPDDIWVSDARGGVARLMADGAPHVLGSGIREPMVSAAGLTAALSWPASVMADCT